MNGLTEDPDTNLLILYVKPIICSNSIVSVKKLL